MNDPLSRQTDQDFLSTEQYDDSEGLDIRNRIQAAYRTHPLPWFTWVFEKLSFIPGSHVLESGCGSGSLWIENQSRLSGPWNLVLTDLSSGMVTEARDQIRSIQPGIPAKFDYAVLNAEAGPFRAGHFDVIIALGLLDHLPNRSKTLDEISRLLKPAGRFFASAGGSSHLQEIERLVRPFLPEVNFGGDPDRFGLENGARLLAPWFADVQLLKYDNDLVFDRPEPVLAYILSEAQVRLSVDKDRWAALRRSVEDQLGSAGEIRVTTSKGLFIATK